MWKTTRSIHIPHTLTKRVYPTLALIQQLRTIGIDTNSWYSQLKTNKTLNKRQQVCEKLLSTITSEAFVQVFFILLTKKNKSETSICVA